MELIDKIKDVTSYILEIYDSLVELEWTKSHLEYQEKIEELKLYKELEDQYYLKLKEIMLKKPNVIKNIMCEDLDIDYFFDFDGLMSLDNFYLAANNVITRSKNINKAKKELMTERIYNRYIILLNEICTNDEILENLYRENIISLNEKNEYIFDLNGKGIYIYDRAKDFIIILESANTEIYGNYLYLLQDKLDQKSALSKTFMRHKYNLGFISKNLEALLVDEYFNITLESIMKIRNLNKDNPNQMVKKWRLKYLSDSNYLKLIATILQYKDNDFYGPKRDTQYFYLILEEIFAKACTLTADSDLISENIQENLALKFKDNEFVRKHLIKTLSST